MSEPSNYSILSQDKATELFAPIIKEINKEFHHLESLSNDDLRSNVNSIRIFIENNEDKRKAMNIKLPEAFACIKELGRRFSLGDIEVNANENDRKIARNYDFVQIRGEKAIFKRKWSVNDIPYYWNMVHYDEQLLGGILLHYGYAVEMATGEGKTLVATLPVFLNALSHDSVHLMTANNYLSKRDCEITRPLYLFFGLSVDCIEFYERGDIRRKFAYQADIAFGTTSSFTFDYLWDHLATDPNECVQRKHNYAIIDELDDTLIDESDNPHIVGGGRYYDISQIYRENIQYVRELINCEESATLYTQDLLQHSADFTVKGYEWLREKVGDKDLFKETKTYQIEGFELLEDTVKERIFQRLARQNALRQLLRALTVYEKDVDYIVSKQAPHDLVVIIDQNTGRLKKSSRWEHGLHTAIEVKEGVRPQPDFDGLGVISVKNYLKTYAKVAGMSGTIMAAADELNEIYGLKCAAIPPHKPNVRVDFPLNIFRTCSDKDNAILEVVKEAHQSGRPVLLGCLNIKRAEHLSRVLHENKIEHNVLDAKNEADESLIVAKAGIGNTITVSTGIAGRGTDIKPSKDALANGGLLVVGADLFYSIRVNQQLKGRTGRQGNPGSSIFFASLEDSVFRYLVDSDRTRLETLLMSENGNKLNSPEIMSLFTVTQNNMEKHQREKRRETARKDDIIAPRRIVFYGKRNRILRDANAATEIIDLLIQSKNLSESIIEGKLKDMYMLFSILLEKFRSIWPDKEKLTVPLSCQGLPYTLTFPIRNRYDISIFSSEYKRQLILSIYDKYWKEFVIYILSELDNKEIDGLDRKFNDMMDEVEKQLAKFICNSKIIFNPQMIEDKRELINPPEIPEKKQSKISFSDMCPCGSGKKYCECHGRNTRKKPKRRR